ncbi:RNA-guided endonuclease IscB [Deinococcus sp. SL84]|uniref:RNA-guided endonuclease IscB n=1 Tax=Deinococcus sp. SL84 TaxID=2994663 RepID=UPI0022731647|nr:RNA-guided endonuclease IscB [Deinococcus sp. SL84]MCY1703833.1 RNA-guided endonuclease IscB [Deinococcus sp. SL84]
MANRVFVLSPDKTPLMPCTAKRARKMLEAGKAAVWRRYPFTIILKSEAGRQSQPLALKLDPGSKTTGMALVLDGKHGKKAIWGAELHHRGHAIRDSLTKRRQLRASRRSRKLRHRPARFLNRTKPAGWLPPSLMHRVLTVISWAKRLDRFTMLDSFSMELVSFDTQKMMNPDIQRQDYQRGTLFGTEVRAYLMHKWEGKCAYCGKKEKGLEVEHLIPRSRGGSNRISNLVMSCQKCNAAKGSKTPEEFLKRKPAGLKRIQAQQKQSLADTAAVNATKYRLLDELKRFGYPVETGSGAQTSFNRQQQGYDKAHWIDAACVGDSGEQVRVPHLRPLQIKCMGRGNRQMCRTDKYGFPNKHRTRQKVFFSFQTGDICRAIVTTGKKIGAYVGRISVRATGSFTLSLGAGKVDGINKRFFQTLQRQDGYSYGF